MTIEAAVLTGGMSRRMGVDKATLLVDGVPQAERIVSSLTAFGIPVTTLGRVPTPGASFLADSEEGGGPVAALGRFRPSSDLVFVASCDLPLFDAALVPLLASFIGDLEAAVPMVDGWRQPLCGLYQASVFGSMRDSSCAMDWLDGLSCRVVGEEELLAAGIDPRSVNGANTREELDEALGT